MSHAHGSIQGTESKLRMPLKAGRSAEVRVWYRMLVTKSYNRFKNSFWDIDYGIRVIRRLILID